MATNITDTAINFTEISTMKFDQAPVKNVAKWINTMIIILGMITNSLILVILSRRKIGSQTTRIILIFLAVTDLAVMFVEFFIHYVPYYWNWFPVFSSDISCGIAFMMQGAIITTSSWYLMLMTIERFTVVWFPMKAKIVCTQRKILISCILIPIVCLAAYSFFLVDIESFPGDEFGYMQCRPSNETRENYALPFNNKLKIWITLYFFIPAITIVVLNTGIVIRLAKAQKLQQKMSMKNSLKNARQNSVKARTGGAAGKKMVRHSSSSQSSASSSIRKATTLVIAASITFVVLMIPRGVATTLTLNAQWSYDNKTEFILDTVAYQLQYLNHAINFFLYILANNSFRREIKSLVSCSSSSPSRQHTYRRAASYADTDATQTSPNHNHIKSNDRACEHVKLTLKYCLDTVRDVNGDTKQPVQV